VLVPKQEASVLVEAAKAKAVAGCPTVTELDLEEQSSETVSVQQFATEAVVPTSMLEAFFQEYLIVPTAPVTVPAVTEPVLVPNKKHPI
jgi:hypothetical protein